MNDPLSNTMLMIFKVEKVHSPLGDVIKLHSSMGTNLERAFVAVRIGSRFKTVLASLVRSPNGRTQTSSVFWSYESYARFLILQDIDGMCIYQKNN